MRPEKMYEEIGIEIDINRSKAEPYALSEYQRSMHAIFGRRTKRYELDLYLKTSSLPIGFWRNSLKTFYSLLTSKSFRDYFFL